jgi:hypothetical protein
MPDRSIADQELFLPPEGQDSTQNSSQSAAPTRPRYYESLNNNSAPDHAQSTEQNSQPGVPTFNVIGPTPSTSRSSTVRTNASQPTGPNAMTGALPGVTEEDNLYDAPTSAANNYSEPQQSSHQYNATSSPAMYEHSYSSPEAPAQAPPPPPPPPAAMDSSSAPALPASETWASAPHKGMRLDNYSDHSAQAWASGAHATPTHSVGQSAPQTAESWNQGPSNAPSSAPHPPPHPPTYDEYKASRAGEVPPPLPGPRPPVQSTGTHEDHPSSSAHPAMHLESDQVGQLLPCLNSF